MKRGTPLARSSMRSRPRPTGPIPAVVELVYERGQWSCELCTSPLGDRRGDDHHLHHRRPRRSGGDRRPDTNLPMNLLLLCPGCHEVVESHRTASYRAGWLLAANASPAMEPVLLERGARWALLLPNGQSRTVDAPVRAGYTETET